MPVYELLVRKHYRLIVTGWHGYLPTNCGMVMRLYGHKDAVGLSMSDQELLHTS